MLCKMEYLSYELTWEYPEVHKAFDKCAKEHLNNPEIKYKLYQRGLSEAAADETHAASRNMDIR